MNILNNGTVLPSGLLSVNNQASSQGFNNAFNNTSLKAGIVVKKYLISDPENFNKVLPEYDVVVIEQNANLGPSTKTYRRCVTAQGLGSIADFFEYTLREQEGYDSKKGIDFDDQNGANVLILCLDGNDEKAVIISAIKHPGRTSKLTEENVMAGEFNGFGLNVGNDGSAKIYAVGPTDNEGAPTNAEHKETSLIFESDGGILAQHENATFHMGRKGNALFKTLKTLDIQVLEETASVFAKKSFSLTTEKLISMDSKDMLLKLSGSANIEAPSLKIKSPNEIGIEAGQFSIKASAMLKVESPSITLNGLTMLGGSGGTPVLTMTTQTLGIGFAGTPVLSTPIAGFATKVMAV